MTDKNETVPRPTPSSNLKGNATVTSANIPASISLTTTATTTTTVVGGGGNYRHPSKCGSHSSSFSPSSSQRRKKNREESDSGGTRHLLDKEPISSSPEVIPPPYQYQTHQLHQKPRSSSSSILGSSSSIIPSDHHHNVTSDADFLDGKASSHLHHGKKHGRTSSQQHHHHSSGRTQSAMTGDIGSSLVTGNEYRDNPVPTSDVQEAIRNLLTSVDTASSASSSPPLSAHHQHRHPQTSRSSSSSPTRYTSHSSAANSTGSTPKVSHKKILPPSPIVVDSPSRTPRRKLDGVIMSGGSVGSVGAKSAPTYSCSPPVVPPHASSCPSPPPIGRYSGASGSPGSLSMKKDDILLPPTRSSASVRARSFQNISAITTVASSVISSVTTSRSGSDSTKLYHPPNIQSPSKSTNVKYGSASVTSNKSAKDKGRNSTVDSDSSSVPNFYKTSQKLVEISDARPKYKASSGNSGGLASAGYSSDSNRSRYGSIGNNNSSSSNSKKSGHHSHSHGVHGGGGVNSNKSTNYNRGYRSLEKENTGSYGGYVTGYSNTIGSCGLGVDQSTNHDKEKADQEQQHNQSTEGKPTRSSKDHVYYTADRPSRRNMPTTGGSSHRASSVPARRSMSVSEFAGTSVDPEPGNGQSDGENLEKVKSKLMSMWNNVKYGEFFFFVFFLFIQFYLLILQINFSLNFPKDA